VEFKFLDIFRVIQAIAGSADYPTAMAIIAVTFTKGQRKSASIRIMGGIICCGISIRSTRRGPIDRTRSMAKCISGNIPVGIIGNHNGHGFHK